MDRRKFLEMVPPAAVGIVLGGVSAWLITEPGRRTIRDQNQLYRAKIDTLSWQNQNLEDRLSGLILQHEAEKAEFERALQELEEKYSGLMAHIREDGLEIDYNKHPFRTQIKKYEPFLDDALKKYSSIYPVSKLLMLCLVEAESGFGSHNFSLAGAAYDWQLIPETARDMGLHVETTDNYEKGLDYRAKRRSQSSVLASTRNELRGFIQRFSDGEEFRTVGDFLEHLDERYSQANVNRAKYLFGELDNQQLYYAILQDKERGYMSLYKADMIEIDKLPEAEVLKKDERKNLKLATDAAVHYMAYLMKKAEGNPLRALSMYNAGPGNVQIMPYTETVGYIDKIFHKYHQYKKILAGKGSLPTELAPPNANK
ncbi:MAG: hypothetical protein QS98_C0012G0039 [archaeon GW2011_AR3]|nr:MAG: hypothetical protein QS98_C0012G0039 [archaeon GW2011_AR3]MBS3109021.1 transglycosylase SLT domain-containing protein [Candidatus Woesearchaeota archaeon]